MHILLPDRERKRDRICKKDWIRVLECTDILAGKVLHHENDSIAWNNKVDISINKVGYAFLTNQNKMNFDLKYFIFLKSEMWHNGSVY